VTPFSHADLPTAARLALLQYDPASGYLGVVDLDGRDLLACDGRLGDFLAGVLWELGEGVEFEFAIQTRASQVRDIDTGLRGLRMASVLAHCCSGPPRLVGNVTAAATRARPFR
jgi:hypothetical protein